MGILLVLVAMMMLTTLVIGLGQMTFADRVQRDGESLLEGERCRLAVQSALDEAAHQFAREANDPEAHLFRRLRHGRAFDGTVPVAVSAQAFGNKGPLDSDKVRFHYEPTVTDDGPYMGGMVTFEAKAGRGWLRRDARHGTATREVRVAPVTPPRPFDEVTLLILEPFPGLLDPARANTDLEEDVQKSKQVKDARTAMAALLDRVTTHLERAGQVGPRFRSKLSAVAQSPLPEHPEYSNDVEKRHHFIDPATVVASFEKHIENLRGLAIEQPEVDRMAQAVEDAAPRAADEEKKLEEALEKILSLEPSAIGEADGAASSQVDEVIDRLTRKVDSYRKASLRLAKALADRSARYTVFTDSVVEYTSSGARNVREMARALFDVDNTWRERAAFVFESTRELAGFLASYKARNEGVRGIVYQASSSSPVSLGELELDGRLAIATPATITCAGESTMGRGHTLTLVTSRFELNGECRAAVVCRHFQGSPGARLTGRLLIEELRSASELEGSLGWGHRPGNRLAEGGERRGQGRRPRGRRPDHREAVVSPWCLAGGIQRGV